MDKYLRIYDGSTEIFWLGKAVFGTYSGIVQPNPAGNIFFGVLSDNLGYIGSGLIVQPTSVGINRVTGSTIDFAENLTNFAGFDGNKNLYVNHNISAYEVDVYYLNVSTNATIPHFNINSTLALSTNYTNRNDKVIRIDLSIVSATTALSTDQAEIKVVLNDFDVLTPKNVIMCGTRSANRLAQSIDYHCVIDIPARFNYTIYPAVANGGTVQLSEVHIVDE